MTYLYTFSGRQNSSISNTNGIVMTICTTRRGVSPVETRLDHSFDDGTLIFSCDLRWSTRPRLPMTASLQWRCYWPRRRSVVLPSL